MTLHRARASLPFSFSFFFVCHVLRKNLHKLLNSFSVVESLEQGCLVRFCRLTFFPRSFFSNFKSYAYIWSNTRVAGSCIDYSVNSCYLYIFGFNVTKNYSYSYSYLLRVFFVLLMYFWNLKHPITDPP